MSILVKRSLKRSRDNDDGPRDGDPPNKKQKRVYFVKGVKSSPPHIYPIIEKIKKCVDHGPWSEPKLMSVINAIKDQITTDVKFIAKSITYIETIVQKLKGGNTYTIDGGRNLMPSHLVLLETMLFILSSSTEKEALQKIQMRWNQWYKPRLLAKKQRLEAQRLEARRREAQRRKSICEVPGSCGIQEHSKIKIHF